MRHTATNPEDDGRTSPIRNADSRRAGIRKLDCGHDLSHDRELERRSAGVPDAPARAHDAPSAQGQQQQST